MKKDEEAYTKWYNEFQMFLKEGMVSDRDNAENLLKLARFDSSVGKNLSIDDYVKNMRDGQEKIYYIMTQSHSQAVNSPFMDPFKDSKVPVIFIYVAVDEIVFRNMNEYKKLKFVLKKITNLLSKPNRSISNLATMKSQRNSRAKRWTPPTVFHLRTSPVFASGSRTNSSRWSAR